MSLIHLVDDDVAVTDACHFLLTSLGHDVQCWNDSTDFLAQADLFQTGLVLLDMRMPKLDGHQAYAELRRLRQHAGGGVPVRPWRRADGGGADEVRRGGLPAKTDRR